jgi:hypothetical protein
MNFESGMAISHLLRLAKQNYFRIADVHVSHLSSGGTDVLAVQ